MILVYVFGAMFVYGMGYIAGYESGQRNMLLRVAHKPKRGRSNDKS
jgi:hypothetical protein